MRILFAGTPDVALPTLRALYHSTFDVVGVLTRPPARSGRRRELTASPVAQEARGLGIDLLETATPGSEDSLAWIQAKQADLGVVVAYGALLREPVLKAPRQGWLNLHFSALPYLRGAAPVQHALLNGDRVIGTTVFQLDTGLDTGPILSLEEHEIPAGATAGQLLSSLATVGAEQVVKAIEMIANGSAIWTDQPEDAPEQLAYASKLAKSDGYIDFAVDADQVVNRIRAVTPSPGAWTYGPQGEVIRLGPVLQDGEMGLSSGQIQVGKSQVHVGCASGTLLLGELAPAGRKWMSAADWARGAKLSNESRMGERHANET